MKAAREKNAMICRGKTMQLKADSSLETMEYRRQLNDMFKVLTKKNNKPQVLYPAKPFFINADEINVF